MCESRCCAVRSALQRSLAHACSSTRNHFTLVFSFLKPLSLSLIQNRLLCPRTLSSCIGPQSAFGVSALRLAMVDDCCCYSCLSLYCIRIGNIVASRAAVASRSHRICGNKSAKRCVFAVNIKHSHSILAGFTRRRHVACAHVKSHGAQ